FQSDVGIDNRRLARVILHLCNVRLLNEAELHHFFQSEYRLEPHLMLCRLYLTSVINLTPQQRQLMGFSLLESLTFPPLQQLQLSVDQLVDWLGRYLHRRLRSFVGRCFPSHQPQSNGLNSVEQHRHHFHEWIFGRSIRRHNVHLRPCCERSFSFACILLPRRV